MKEYDLINFLAKDMPRSPLQKNALFESDSEILDASAFSNTNMLVSTDEFSDEDLFLTGNAYNLGYNICVATLSDIIATGGKPLYYAHSLTINDSLFTQAYLKDFYRGIGDVLAQAGAFFIGGDFGKADSWRCCTTAIGTSDRPVKRSGAQVGDNIYLTGLCGSGNLSAAVSMYNIPFSGQILPRFTLRHGVVSDLKSSASAAIDTSDGVFNAVSMIAEQSGVGFALKDIPYIKLGVAASKLLKLPVEMLAVCECGEYEILFTSPHELPYYKIGEITKKERTLNAKDVSHINISARSFNSIKEYIKEVSRICGEL